MRPLFVAICALAGATLAGPATAAITPFLCNVDEVTTFTNRVTVHCAQPYNTSIYFFAAPASDRDFAARMEAIGLVAQVTGTVARVYFDPNDLSGTSFGCGSNDCRRITGIEVYGAGPLASAPAASLTTEVASTLPEPAAPAQALAAGATLLGWGRRRARRWPR
jgi:hypothetical protein